MHKVIFAIIALSLLNAGNASAQSTAPAPPKTMIYNGVKMNIIPYEPGKDFSRTSTLEENEIRKQKNQELDKAFALLWKGKTSASLPTFQKYYAQGRVFGIFERASDGLAQANRLNGNLQKAIDYYEFIILPSPEKRWSSSRASDRDFRAKYALLLQQAGRYDEAWEQYQYAINVDSGWVLPKPPVITRAQVPTAQFVFAASLVVASEMGSDNMQGVSFARDAAKANPGSGLPHYYMGELLFMSDPANAKAEYEKVVRYGRGKYVERAKARLLWVESELAKVTVPKP